MVKFNKDGQEFFATVNKIVPSNAGIAVFNHNNANKNSKNQIWLSFSKFNEIGLTKSFITPSGKVYDSGPILKKINQS